MQVIFGWKSFSIFSTFLFSLAALRAKIKGGAKGFNEVRAKIFSV
jgi:hypothetical protein